MRGPQSLAAHLTVGPLHQLARMVCHQKMQFDRDQVFFNSNRYSVWENSRRPTHEKATANLDSERCSYIEEACKQKNASGNDCPNFEENRGGDAAKGF
jgi:hypothetical protein